MLESSPTNRGQLHVLIVNTERCETITLCCEILSLGRDAGVSDEHLDDCSVSPPSPGIFAGQAYANSQARRYLALGCRGAAREGVPMNDPLLKPVFDCSSRQLHRLRLVLPPSRRQEAQAVAHKACRDVGSYRSSNPNPSRPCTLSVL